LIGCIGHKKETARKDSLLSERFFVFGCRYILGGLLARRFSAMGFMVLPVVPLPRLSVAPLAERILLLATD
jgi:hypothetical protein